MPVVYTNRKMEMAHVDWGGRARGKKCKVRYNKRVVKGERGELSPRRKKRTGVSEWGRDQVVRVGSTLGVHTINEKEGCKEKMHGKKGEREKERKRKGTQKGRIPSLTTRRTGR